MSMKKVKSDPKEGDEKIIKGIRHVRRHYRSEGCYVTKNGQYLYEWVKPYISRCCGADAFINSSNAGFGQHSNYYMCTKCGKACDTDPYLDDILHGKDTRLK